MSRFLVTAAEMKALDRAAIEKHGIPGIILMENAGKGAFDLIKSSMKKAGVVDIRELTVAVVAGTGSNGGDGFVVARHLLNAGAAVYTLIVGSKSKIKGDALTNIKILEKMTLSIDEVTSEEAADEALDILNTSDLIVDAVFGYGFKPPMPNYIKMMIEGMNEAPAFRVAIDIPSGLDADTGYVEDTAVMADLTVTFGYEKIGAAMAHARLYCGLTRVVDIGVPVTLLFPNPPGAMLYTEPTLIPLLEKRANPAAHKGDFGHLLIVGGSSGKTGAPCMAAKAAMRIGAGLVTVAAPASLHTIIAGKLTEEMSYPLADKNGIVSGGALKDLLKFAAGKECVVLGPGLSTEKGAVEIVKGLISNYSGTLVIDADGLNILAQDLSVLDKAKGDIVLTPHPGEMARLVGKSIEEVQANRIEIARRFADEYDVWLVLKGAGTLTATPMDEYHVTVNSTGNSWMASAGQGDVLSGILGGLLAQGIDVVEALPLGVYLHGLAADSIVNKVGPAPVLASDVIEELRPTLRKVLKSLVHQHVAGIEDEEEGERSIVPWDPEVDDECDCEDDECDCHKG